MSMTYAIDSVSTRYIFREIYKHCLRCADVQFKIIGLHQQHAVNR